MPLISCPECNHQTKTTVSACPECGFPLRRFSLAGKTPRKTSLLKPLLYISGAIALISIGILIKTIWPGGTKTGEPDRGDRELVYREGETAQREDVKREDRRDKELVFREGETAQREDVKVEPKKEESALLPKYLTNSIGMKLALIPPGKFTMGSPPNNKGFAGDQHEVEITKPFYLGIYEVTQAQWQAVMGNNPSQFKGDDLPVESVSWDDCQEFCQRLSLKEGRLYRFPTEAEWEYACRAGTTTVFHYGNSLSSKQANCDFGEGRRKTAPVGSYQPNAFGLYDMHGNVCEWCADWYDVNYYGWSPRQDPQGPPTGQSRVLRGGSWVFPDFVCSAAARGWFAPGQRILGFGFRVASNASRPWKEVLKKKEPAPLLQK